MNLLGLVCMILSGAAWYIPGEEMQRFANPNMVIRRAGFKDYRLDHGKFPDPKYGAIYP